MRKKLTGVLAAGVIAGLTVFPAGTASADPAPGKEMCKNGGHVTLRFANQGQCVKAANQAAKAGEPFPPGAVVV